MARSVKNGEGGSTEIRCGVDDAAAKRDEDTWPPGRPKAQKEVQALAARIDRDGGGWMVEDVTRRILNMKWSDQQSSAWYVASAGRRCSNWWNLARRRLTSHRWRKRTRGPYQGRAGLPARKRQRPMIFCIRRKRTPEAGTTRFWSGANRISLRRMRMVFCPKGWCFIQESGGFLKEASSFCACCISARERRNASVDSAP